MIWLEIGQILPNMLQKCQNCPKKGLKLQKSQSTLSDPPPLNPYTQNVDEKTWFANPSLNFISMLCYKKSLIRETLTLSTNGYKSTNILFLFFFAIEVLMKCHWSANRQQPQTVLNWDDKVRAPCHRSPWVAWRALEILVVFTSAFKWKATCRMKVKQSLSWYV